MPQRSLVPGLLLAAGALSGLPAPGDTARASASETPRASAGVRFDLATRATRDVAGPLAKVAPLASGVRARAGSRPVSSADRDESAFRPRKVFGEDDRYAVPDPTAYPWSTVCKVVAEFPDGSAVEGSAVLVGDRFALTAGHVIFDDRAGGFAETVEVVPSFDFGDAPFGRYAATDITSFSGWTRDGDYDWDFALLRLDGAPGDETGWLGLASYDDAFLAGLTVNTGGYPGDLDGGRAMYGATGVISRVLPGQVEMRGELDAAQGQSGSGAWVRRDRDGDVERYVLGVVSTETSTANRAARVTDEVFDALSAWMDEADLPDFVVADLSADVPAEFEAPRSVRATVAVANDGATGATAEVALLARDVYGERRVLARRDVSVAAGAEVDVTFVASVGESFPAGTWSLVAEVNGDRSVAESDFDDNRRRGPAFVVLPPYADLAPGETASVVVDPGGVVRRRIAVPAGLRRLRLLLGGARGAFATVTRPDGSRFVVPASRRAVVDFAPPGGTWLVDVRVPVTAPRAKLVRFRASPRT